MNWIDCSEEYLDCDVFDEYDVVLMKNTDTGKFAFFKNDCQYSEEFDDILSDVEESGIFSHCICVERNHLANYICVSTGTTVIPYWCDDIDDNGSIECGDYTGYIKSSDGVLMEGGIGECWWPFNWNNNTIERNPYKEIYDTNKANLSEDCIEIAEYLYKHDIKLFNKYMKLEIKKDEL